MSASSTTSGATIYYSTDGTTFSATAPGPLGDGTTTVYAYATSGTCQSNTVQEVYLVDTAAPTVTGAAWRGTVQLSGADHNDWYNQPFTIKWSGNDGSVPPASGVASCDADTSFSGPDSSSASATGQCTDIAGNQGTGTFGPFQYDATAPNLSYSLDKTAAGTGWYNLSTGAPTVSFSCTDNLSGVDGSCPGNYTFPESAGQSYLQTIYDVAGNSTSNGPTGINVDLTAPTLSGAPTTSPNGAGWYNSNVTIHWTCGDTLSGIDGSCPANSTISSEGTGLTASASVSDKAGNKTDADSSPAVNIDKTAPALNISGAASGTYNVCAGAPSRPTFAPSDAVSGLDGSQGDSWTTPTVGSGVGTYTYSAHATDVAGNPASETRTYTVQYGAAFGGFLQPINPDNSSRFKLGSTVPVKFQLLCGGTPVSNAVAKLNVKQADGSADPGVDEAISTAASTTGNLFRYDSTAKQYIFNLSTKSGYTNPSGSTVSFAAGTWTLSVLLDDGTYRSINIQLVK